jgi:hypothetical protein
MVLRPKWRLETGLKGDYTQSRSGSGIESRIDGDWVSSAASVSAIRMQEGIAAGYMSVHGAIGGSAVLDLGFRYEYSETRLNNAVSGIPIDRRRQGLLFPNLLLTRKSGENGQWQLSYTRRIARPSYRDLSSFVNYNDPFSVFTGNPLLKPTTTSSVKVGYGWKAYTLAIAFARDVNPIFRSALTSQAGSTLVYIRPENLAFQNSLNFEANLPFRVGDWWIMSYGFTGGWRQYEIGYIPGVPTRIWFGWSVNFHENFRLPARFSAEIAGWYNGTSYESTNRINGVGELNLGVKRELGRGSLQFTVTDLFRMMNFKSYVGAAGKDAFDTRTYISYDTETRRFPLLRLTYSRAFGTAVGSQGRGERAGEEKERIR